MHCATNEGKDYVQIEVTRMEEITRKSSDVNARS